MRAKLEQLGAESHLGTGCTLRPSGVFDENWTNGGRSHLKRYSSPH